jgi:hypothetical protein
MNKSTVFTSNWIGNLAAFVSGLSSEQILFLAEFYGGGIEGTALPSTTELQRRLALGTTSATSLARNLREISLNQDVTSRDMRIALASFAQGRVTGRRSEEMFEVVCTAPSRFGIPVRTTFATAVEMVQAARNEIFVVGYLITRGARALVEALAQAVRDRRVRITFIGNRMQAQLPTLQSIWPNDVRPPDVFSREGGSINDISALHAKLLICDGKTALVTSANFSHHGLHENIEVGVKIHSASVKRLVEFVNAMIRNGAVEVVNWG